MFDSKVHNELVKAYLDYFAMHEEWERRPSIRKYYNIRKQMKKIVQIAIDRNKEIRTEYLSIKEKYSNPNNSRDQKNKR